MENEELLKEFQGLRNIKEISKDRYKYSLLKYSKYHNMKLDELLNEAEEEEDEGIRPRRRKIKQRLNNFKEYMEKENLHPQTINSCLSHVKTFYKTYDILPPNISNKVSKDKTHETIDDIPTIEHIKVATQTNNVRNNALILFMASSGTASAETRSLTIYDFIKATSEYHHSNTLKGVLNELSNIKGIIPTWHMIRIKTNYPYFTFNSPEASETLIKYLKTRYNAKNDEKLFPIKISNFSQIFNRINDSNNWGYKETRCFFHSHALRKFFATELMKSGLDFLKIQWMSGRHIDSTTAAYFKADPNNLKKEYMRVVNNLSVNKVKIHDVNTKEYLTMKKAVENTEKENDKLWNAINELQQNKAFDLTNLSAKQKEDLKKELFD